MKRIALLIISAIILSCSIFSVSSAESVSFSVDSVQTDVNRVAEVGVNCTDTANLGAVVFDFDYDKSALEFRGAESGGAVRFYEGEKLRVVYYCDDNSSSESGILKLKFKTIREGNYNVSYDIAECSTKSGENFPVDFAESGSVSVSGNGKNQSNNLSSESAKISDGKRSAKSNASGGKNDDYDDSFDESDESELAQKGDFNSVQDSHLFPYFLIFVIVIAFFLISIVILLTVRMIIKKNKSAADSANKK